MKFNLFTFLKENKILVVVKTKLLKVLENKKEDLKEKVLLFIQEETPQKQEVLVNFIISNIELPIYLKPFKPLIKKTINKNITKIIVFITQQIEKY